MPRASLRNARARPIASREGSTLRDLIEAGLCREVTERRRRRRFDMVLLVRASPGNAPKVYAALQRYGAPLGAHGVTEGLFELDRRRRRPRVCRPEGPLRDAAVAYNAGLTRLRKALRGETELSEETERYRSLVAALWSERQLPESSFLGE
jgi:hypothetical protein